MTPETSSSPFDAAIAELESRIRNMQITLETLKQLRTEGGGVSTGNAFANVNLRPGESEVQHDTFFGMTIGDAAKKFLIMSKATKSTADIAAALEQGGLKHSSKDFPTTVRSVLRNREDFLRVPNGDWGLSEWYPGMGRGKKGTAEKPEKPATAKSQSKPRASKKKATLDTEEASPAATNAGQTRRERILLTMQSDPTKAWTAGGIAKASGDPSRKFIQAMLVRMVADGEIEKAESSGYRLKTQKHAA